MNPDPTMSEREVVLRLTREQAGAMGDLYRSLEFEINETPSAEAFKAIRAALASQDTAAEPVEVEEVR